MQTSRLLIALLALMAAGPLTAQDEPPTQRKAADDDSDAGEARSAEPETVVTLLEAGEGPRQELRYGPGAGATMRQMLSVRSVHEVTVMGMNAATNFPEVQWTLESSVQEAEQGDGDTIVLQLMFEGAQVVEGHGAEQAAIQRASRSANMLNGRTAELTLSNRGMVGELNMPGPPPKPGTLIEGDTLESLREAIRTSVVLLPVEAVGKGAKWKVQQQRESSGVKSSETIEYEITAMDGENVELSVKRTRTAEEQEIAGVTTNTTLRSFESSADGTISVSLGHPLPSALTLAEKAKMDVAISGRGGTFVMHQVISTWNSIGAAPARESKSERGDEVQKDAQEPRRERPKQRQ